MVKVSEERADPVNAAQDVACRGGVDPVTLAGLVFETATGLRRQLGPGLERDYDFPAQSFEVLIRLRARLGCGCA